MAGSIAAIPMIVSLAVSAPPAQETLRDLVRRQGDVTTMVLIEYEPAELPDLVRGADLISRVVIVDERSRLSPDERAVMTDYTAQVLDVVHAVRSAPQQGSSIVITRPGGAVTIDGHRVRSTEPEFPPFRAGEYVLFLKKSEGGFEVYYGPQGAFAIVAGAVNQVSRFKCAWISERGTAGLPAFLGEITALAAGKQE